MAGTSAVQRPTYLELVAAERIVPAIEAVVVHSLAVYAQQHPRFARILNWQDELATVLLGLLEANSVLSEGCSFAEGLYGLRRIPRATRASSTSQLLTGKQKAASIVLLTLYPYAKAKLRMLYDEHQASTLLHPGPRPLSVASFAGPTLALLDLLDFTTQATYLLLNSPTFSWTHAAAGVTIVRSPTDWPQAESMRKTPTRGVERVLGAGVVGVKAFLVAMVVGIKAVEWWYLVAEKRLEERLPEAVPPPPPPPNVGARGRLLLGKEGTCPLCTREYEMPAHLAVSGFVFCYTCLLKHVRREGTCPVTHVPAKEADIRHLYLEV